MYNEKNKEKYLKKENNHLYLLNELIENLQKEEEELENSYNKKDFKKFELVKTNIQKTQRALSEVLRKI